MWLCFTCCVTVIRVTEGIINLLMFLVLKKTKKNVWYGLKHVWSLWHVTKSVVWMWCCWQSHTQGSYCDTRQWQTPQQCSCSWTFSTPPSPHEVWAWTAAPPYTFALLVVVVVVVDLGSPGWDLFCFTVCEGHLWGWMVPWLVRVLRKIEPMLWNLIHFSCVDGWWVFLTSDVTFHSCPAL